MNRLLIIFKKSIAVTCSLVLTQTGLFAYEKDFHGLQKNSNESVSLDRAETINTLRGVGSLPEGVTRGPQTPQTRETNNVSSSKPSAENNRSTSNGPTTNNSAPEKPAEKTETYKGTLSKLDNRQVEIKEVKQENSMMAAAHQVASKLGLAKDSKGKTDGDYTLVYDQKTNTVQINVKEGVTAQVHTETWDNRGQTQFGQNVPMTVMNSNELSFTVTAASAQHLVADKMNVSGATLKNNQAGILSMDQSARAISIPGGTTALTVGVTPVANNSLLAALVLNPSSQALSPANSSSSTGIGFAGSKGISLEAMPQSGKPELKSEMAVISKIVPSNFQGAVMKTDVVYTENHPMVAGLINANLGDRASIPALTPFLNQAGIQGTAAITRIGNSGAQHTNTIAVRPLNVSPQSSIGHGIEVTNINNQKDGTVHVTVAGNFTEFKAASEKVTTDLSVGANFDKFSSQARVVYKVDNAGTVKVLSAQPINPGITPSRNNDLIANQTR